MIEFGVYAVLDVLYETCSISGSFYAARIKQKYER